jgi:predicted nucleic-acid-binding Zn-ribbon protein
MQADTPCAKCGSRKIIPMADVMDQGQHSDGKLKAVVYKNPEAWVFKGAVTGRIAAKICVDCGFTELYTTNAKELYDAHRASGK